MRWTRFSTENTPTTTRPCSSDEEATRMVCLPSCGFANGFETDGSPLRCSIEVSSVFSAKDCQNAWSPTEDNNSPFLAKKAMPSSNSAVKYLESDKILSRLSLG